MNTRQSLILPFLLLAVIALRGQAGIEWRLDTLPGGIIWKQAHPDSLYGHPQHLNILEADSRRVKADLLFVTDTLVRTSAMAASAGAVAAVNAGFFDVKAGGSVTFLKVGGKLINLTRPNHLEAKSEILRGAIIIDKRGRLTVAAAGPDEQYLSRRYHTVLLTGPLLLSGGNPVALAERPFNDNRHPRTCACITDDERMLLLTVDGRTASSHGMALPELRTLLQSLGCRDAVNLDGGGSTTMWVQGQVVNMPCDNKLFDHAGERPVANALILRAKP